MSAPHPHTPPEWPENAPEGAIGLVPLPDGSTAWEFVAEDLPEGWLWNYTGDARGGETLTPAGEPGMLDPVVAIPPPLTAEQARIAELEAAIRQHKAEWHAQGLNPGSMTAALWAVLDEDDK